MGELRGQLMLEFPLVTNVEGQVAVCNVTLEELKAAKLVSQEGKTVVTVVEHKTGREGHTKLLGIDYQCL